MTNEIKLIFIFLLVIWIFPSVNYLFVFYARFPVGFLLFIPP